MASDGRSSRLTGNGAGLGNTVIVLIVVLLGVFAFAALRLARDLARTGAAEHERRSKIVTPAPTPAPLVPVPRPPLPATGQPFPYAATGLRPRGSPRSWVSNDDYPAAAIRAEQQGTVGFTLSVDAEGRPSACAVTRSSGVALLDETSCSLMMRRARFEPARDADGNTVPAQWPSRFRWQLP